MNNAVKFKGSGGRLEFWLEPGLKYAELREALRDRLNENAELFKSSTYPVMFYGKLFTPEQKRELRNLLSEEYAFNHVSFVDDELSEKAVPQEHVFIKGGVKNGHSVDAKGNITVIGDVAGGARLSAGGSIAVLGELFGSAHAGAMGDASATVSAVKLLPKELKIADTAFDLSKLKKPKRPQTARLDEGAPVIEESSPKRKR